MRSRRLSWARVRRSVGLACALAVLAATATTALVARTPERAGAANTSGYWLVATDGGVFTFGQASFHGSTGDIKLNQPIVGMAPTLTGRGYWMVASDGGIFAFGDAGFFGSMGGKPLNKPIVALASTKSGKGYWLVAADGGIFAFGDAGFFGSTGDIKLNKPIVDLSTTPSGRGYWMTATDGGIFAFGDGGFFGSTGDVNLTQRIHAMASTPTGKGYWMVAGDGGIFSFGDAGFHGSAAGGGAEKRVIDIAPSSTGKGYYITTSSGQVLGYGDAKHYGDTETQKIKLNNRIQTMAAMNGNDLPIAVDDVITVDEDGVVGVDVLANDRDPDGGPLSLRSAGLGSHGTTSVVGRNGLYRPAPDFHGSDSFTYVVVDDRGDSAVGRVTVNVKSIDDKPDANDDEITVFEDTPSSIAIFGNDSGLGDGLKSLEITKQPSHGTASANADGTIRYTPDKDFSDPTTPDSLEYEVKDVDGDTARATVKVKVLPADDLPVAVDDHINLPGNGKDVTARVLDNDQPGDGEPQIRLVDPSSGAPGDGPVGFAGAGVFERKDSNVRFRPEDSFVGSVSVQYVLVDEDGDVSSPATLSVSVENASPRASSGRASVFQSQITQNGYGDKMDGSDERGWNSAGTGGSRLVYKIVDYGNTGEFFEPRSDGTFQFLPSTPPGTYSFQFTVSDGIEESAPATWIFEVKTDPPPPPPPA